MTKAPKPFWPGKAETLKGVMLKLRSARGGAGPGGKPSSPS